MRPSARTLQSLAVGLDAVFKTPPNIPDHASEEDFELSVGVDELQSAVIGGLSRTSISTGAVLSGIQCAEALLSTHGLRMTPPQLAAVQRLLDALRSA